MNIAKPKTMVNDNKIDDGATIASTPAKINKIPEISHKVLETPGFIL